MVCGIKPSFPCGNAAFLNMTIPQLTRRIPSPSRWNISIIDEASPQDETSVHRMYFCVEVRIVPPYLARGRQTFCYSMTNNRQNQEYFRQGFNRLWSTVCHWAFNFLTFRVEYCATHAKGEVRWYCSEEAL